MEQPYPIFNPHSDHELLRGWLVHAHKSRDRHDFAARRCDTLRYAIGVPAITLAAIVGTSVFSALNQNQELWVKLLVVFLSVAAAVFAALQTFMDYPARAERHRAAAAKYKGLIHEFEQALWAEPRSESRDAKLISGLRDRLADLEESMPVVPQRIYDQVEKRYGSFKFVSSALELVTPVREEGPTGRNHPE